MYGIRVPHHGGTVRTASVGLTPNPGWWAPSVAHSFYFKVSLSSFLYRLSRLLVSDCR